MTSLSHQARHADWIDTVAGAGLVAYGVVHLVIAWLAVQLAFGHHEGSTSTTGAVRELAQQPFGRVIVWLVAVGMVLLALWQVLEAAVGHRHHDHQRTVVALRATSVGKAAVYAAIAISAVQVAVHAGGGSSGGSDSATSSLMNAPAGQFLVAAVGLVIAGVGVGLGVVAWQESYLDRLDAQARAGTKGDVYRWLGRIGYVTKGLSLVLIGALFLYAAITHDAKKSGGLDQALQKVLQQPFGPVLLALMGVGYACFGGFALVQGRHLDR